MVEGNEQGSRISSTTLVWGATIVVVVAILGVSVFVATKNKQASQPSSEPIQRHSPTVDVTYTAPVVEEAPPAVMEQQLEITEPMVDPEKQIEPEPEPEIEPAVVYDGPPVLLLDNLAGTLKIEIPFLAIRNKMPLDHTCFRGNSSPALKWSEAPSGTQSYVVFLEKQDDAEENFVNWILFNIPADTQELSQGQPKTPTLTNGARHANSDHDNVGYIGPCEPQGKFKYALRVFALDTMLDVPAGAHKHDLIRKMNGHIIDAAEQSFIHYRRF